MAILDTVAVNPSDVKIRWAEPYASAGLNEKLCELAPKGIYRGFTLTPSGAWDVVVGLDPVFLDSIAVHENISGYTTTVRLTASETLNGVDPAGAPKTWYVILDVAYSTGIATTAELTLRDALPVGRYVLLGTITIPAGSLALSASMFDQGFSGADWPKWQGLKEFDGAMKLDGGIEGGLRYIGELAGVLGAGGTALSNADAATIDTAGVSLISPDPARSSWTVDSMGFVTYTYGVTTHTRFGSWAGKVDATIGGVHTSAGIYLSENLQADVTVLDRGFVLSCWIYMDSGDNPPDSAVVQVRVSGTAYNAGGTVYQQVVTTKDVWHKIVIPFSQDISGWPTYIRIMDLNSPAKLGKIWVSGLKLERGSIGTVSSQFSVDRNGNMNVDRHLRAGTGHFLDGELRLGGTVATASCSVAYTASRLQISDNAAAPTNVSCGKLRVGTAHGTPIGGIGIYAEENVVSALNLYGITGYCYLGGTYGAPGAFIFADVANGRVDIGAGAVPEKISVEAVYIGSTFADATSPYGIKTVKPIQIVAPTTTAWLEAGSSPPATLNAAIRVGTEGIESTGTYSSSGIVACEGYRLYKSDTGPTKFYFWTGITAYAFAMGLKAATPSTLEMTCNGGSAGRVFDIQVATTSMMNLTCSGICFAPEVFGTEVQCGAGGFELAHAAATIHHSVAGTPVVVNDPLTVAGATVLQAGVAVTGTAAVGSKISLAGATGFATVERLENTLGLYTTAAIAGSYFNHVVTCNGLISGAVITANAGLSITAGGATIAGAVGISGGNLTVTGKIYSNGGSSEILATTGTFTNVNLTGTCHADTALDTDGTCHADGAVTGATLGFNATQYGYVSTPLGAYKPTGATWTENVGSPWYWEDSSSVSTLNIPCVFPDGVDLFEYKVWVSDPGVATPTIGLYSIAHATGIETLIGTGAPQVLVNGANLVTITAPHTVNNATASYKMKITAASVAAWKVYGNYTKYSYTLAAR